MLPEIFYGGPDGAPENLGGEFQKDSMGCWMVSNIHLMVR